jgi:hypothetical protein
MTPYPGWFDGPAGSGEEDLGAAGSPTQHRDVGDHTAKPDSGALEAFGGLSSAVKIQRAEVGTAPSIDLNGYPMQGEAPGGAHGVHGSMAGDNSEPMKGEYSKSYSGRGTDKYD